MSGSTTTGGIAAAILAVQNEVGTLPKTATNPHFKSKFTPLDKINEIVTPVMGAHGLTWSAFPDYDRASGAPTLRYSLTHVPSDQSIAGEMLLLLPKTDPQGQGSAITYARRYAKVAVLDLVADEDVDGNLTAAPAARPAARKAPKESAPKLTPAQVEKAVRLLTDVDPVKVQLELTALGVNDLPDLTSAQVKALIAKVAP